MAYVDRHDVTQEMMKGISALGGANPARERDPNCIDVMLKQIEVQLEESLKSAANLSDKLVGKPRKGEGTSSVPGASDVSSRLARIVNTVHALNQELGTAHGAISG